MQSTVSCDNGDPSTSSPRRQPSTCAWAGLERTATSMRSRNTPRSPACAMQSLGLSSRAARCSRTARRTRNSVCPASAGLVSIVSCHVVSWFARSGPLPRWSSGRPACRVVDRSGARGPAVLPLEGVNVVSPAVVGRSERESLPIKARVARRAMANEARKRAGSRITDSEPAHPQRAALVFAQLVVPGRSARIARDRDGRRRIE